MRPRKGGKNGNIKGSKGYGRFRRVFKIVPRGTIKRKGMLSVKKKVIYKYDGLPQFCFEILLDESDNVEQFAKDNQVNIVSVEENSKTQRFSLPQ